MPDEPKLVVNGREYPMPDSFTLGELADMEKITGQDYDLSKGGVLGTLALAYIAIKRVDPRVTIEELRDVSQDDLEITGMPDLPPAGGALNGSAPPSTESSENISEPAPAKTRARTGAESSDS